MLPQQATIQPVPFPAPIKGIDSVTSLMMLDPTNCIYSKNIDASAFGMVVRTGFTQYADDLTGDVGTIIPYLGRAEDGSEDFLFACTPAGIWDVSTVPTTPTKDYTWVTSTTSPAGFCAYDTFTNDAGARILLVADEANGLVNYVESTQTWAVPTITGATAANLVHVMTWKNRVWYVEKGTNKAWYTAAGTFSGTVTEFNFGSKFSKGGYLKSLHRWTLDSGEGPDDYLVALSSAGDVVVYQGTDPSSASTFGLAGVFYVGEFPIGRNVGRDFGGDLLLLSSYGIVRCSDLVQGKNPFSYEGSLSYKINRDMNSLMNQTLASRGWGIVIQPDLAKIIVTTPKLTNFPHFQFVYDINLEAWSVWTGIPMISADTFSNVLYAGYGTSVYKLDGSVDDLTTLTTPAINPINWSFLTGYSDLGSPEMNKIVELIRPRFTSGGEPVYLAKAYYDYDLSNIVATSGTPSSAIPVWDTSLWDTAIWGGTSSTFESLYGASGIGKNVALAMSGVSSTPTVYIGSGLLIRSAMDSRGLL